jgi:hypothetical protein
MSCHVTIDNKQKNGRHMGINNEEYILKLSDTEG